jgi:hypothetical protein
VDYFSGSRSMPDGTNLESGIVYGDRTDRVGVVQFIAQLRLSSFYNLL